MADYRTSRRPADNATALQVDDNPVNDNGEPRRIAPTVENYVLNDLSTPELRTRLQTIDSILEDLSKKEDRFNGVAFDLQNKEAPMRAEIEALDKKAKEKLGLSMGKTLIDLVVQGKLSRPSAAGVVQGADAFLRAQKRYYDLKDLHADTKKAFKAKEDFQKNKILMWVQERGYVQEILDYRDRKTHENQQGRRRYGR